VPSAADDWTRTVPPKRCAMARLRASPSPTPPVRRDRDGSTRYLPAVAVVLHRVHEHVVDDARQQPGIGIDAQAVESLGPAGDAARRRLRLQPRTTVVNDACQGHFPGSQLTGLLVGTHQQHQALGQGGHALDAIAQHPQRLAVFLGAALALQRDPDLASQSADRTR